MLLGLAVAAAVLGPAGSASAHTRTTLADPAAGAVVQGTPDAVDLVFDDPLAAEPLSLTVLDPAGVDHVVDVSLSGTTVSAELSPGPAGEYRLDYRVAGADGHPVHDGWTFRVEPAPAPAPAVVAVPPSAAAPTAGPSTTSTATPAATPAPVPVAASVADPAAETAAGWPAEVVAALVAFAVGLAVLAVVTIRQVRRGRRGQTRPVLRRADGSLAADRADDRSDRSDDAAGVRR